MTKKMEHEFVPVPKDLKRYVIGKSGSVVKEIQRLSRATVFSPHRDTEGFTVSGSKEQRAYAKSLISAKVEGGRIKEKEKEDKRLCYYIDEWNLHGNYKLKLERVVQDESQEHHYRLKPAKVYAPQGAGSPNCDTSYLEKLKADVLETLCKIKNEMKTKTYLKADMWCHFGTVLIQRPTEGTEGEWDIKEAVDKLQLSREGSHWRARFMGGVNVDEKLIEEHILDKTPEEYDEYSSRYDLTFVMPSGRQLSLKVWVTKEGKKAEDIPTPSSDVKNILQKLHFKDEKTRSRCHGWLILPPWQYLRADILFPGCEFDCRLTIRGRTENALHTDYAPDEDTIKVLSEYLSELTFADEDDFGLCLPKRDLPRGFHLSYKRCSKRALHGFTSEFSIILSKESSYVKHVTTDETRVSTDFHLHCKEWDELLDGRNWEPKAIVKKLPEFFDFVKKIQRCVIHQMDESGLAKRVPPEILARGRSALQAYERALADGKTSMRMVPIMLIGQDRAGKTSLKKSLKGICFDPEENSTVGIDVDPSYFEVTTETWRTGTTDKDSSSNEAISFEFQTAKHMVGSLKKDGKSTDSVHCDSELSETSFVPSSTDPSGDDKSTQTTSRESAHKRDKDVPRRSPDQKQHKKKENDRATSHLPEEVATPTVKLLKSECEENRVDIYSTLWDFAGQSVYYETHPLFLTARAIYCLVYDLSLNPSDKAKSVVKQGVYKKYQDSFNFKTNLDYLEFWMMSVASLASNQNYDQDVRPKSEVLPDKLPAVFLVCTHADKPYEGRDPTEFAREIFGCLKSKPYGVHLHELFVVDNTKSGTDSECSEVISLRKEVLAVAKNLPHINETIPIKWLKFDQAMNALKKGSKYISLEEAKHIASTGCNIKDENEAKALIDYLHDLRSLIHFDDPPELNKLVVLDVQWLIDVFKEVITVRPYDCKEKRFVDMWCKLEKEGILDEKLLTHVWGPLCSNASRSNLIRIMEKFSLLCPWPSETSKSFIVPSMLKTHPGEKVLHLVIQAKIPSLFIKFQNGSVPAGLFCRLVLKFLQWGHRHFLRPVKPELFQKFARFYTSGDKVCSVIFACHTSSVEVVIVAEDDHDIATFTCAGVVCRQVGLMLESMRNEFQWLSSMRYEMSVLCPVCSQGGEIENCRSHDLEWCNQEQCLHFWSLPELFSAKETVICTKSPFAQNTKVHTKEFTPWFAPSGHQELHPTPPIATSQGAATLAGISDQPLKLTLLASEWGSSMGGLSTLNKKLAMFLAKHNQLNVTVLVPEDFCDDAHKRNAKKHNVTIREAQKRPGYDCLDWLGFPPEDLAIDVVLGHGVKLGKQVQAIRRTHHCNWIQVVHTAPEELGMYKDYSKAIAKGQEKKEDEVDLCKLANLVVAVGPKLTETYSSYLRSCKKREDIFQLTPGVFHEFSTIKQGTQDGKNFKVLIFGRGDLEDFVLKGYDTAAKAVALLDYSYRLLFVGASEGKEEEVKDKLLQSGVSERQLIVRTFVKSEEEMKVLFCEVDLAIMPSRTDGFGLTALEALSAGLPILVSSNSGFGETLRELPTGKSHLVESDDPEKWADAIASVRQKKRADRLKEVEELRTSYGERYSWENQCEDLVKTLFSMVHAGKPK